LLSGSVQEDDALKLFFVTWLMVPVFAGAALAGDEEQPKTRLSGKALYTASELSRRDLPDGHVLVQQRLEGIIDTDDTWVLFDGNRQVCFGSVLLDTGGKQTAAAGHCTAWDEDGDAWWMRYLDRDNEQSWSVLTGTGKYHGMTGGGSMQPVTRADGKIEVEWAATIQLGE
jgi:hypothetical protein